MSSFIAPRCLQRRSNSDPQSRGIIVLCGINFIAYDRE